MNIEEKILKEIKSEHSILICGLPGIAYIGKLTLDYLIKQLKADLIGEIYSKFFPPYVVIKKNGIVELLKNELYYLKINNEKDMIFFTGNAQASSPEGQYEIANKILNKAIEYKVTRVYSIAALLTNRPFRTPKVYGVVTNSNLLNELEKFNVTPLKQGIISGTNGLVFALAKKKNIEGVCLLGETHGFQTTSGHYLFDSKAVRAILDVFVKMVNLEIDMKPLDKQTGEMEELIAKMVDIERQARKELQESTDSSSSYIT